MVDKRFKLVHGNLPVKVGHQMACFLIPYTHLVCVLYIECILYLPRLSSQSYPCTSQEQRYEHQCCWQYVGRGLVVIIMDWLLHVNKWLHCLQTPTFDRFIDTPPFLQDLATYISWLSCHDLLKVKFVLLYNDSSAVDLLGGVLWLKGIDFERQVSRHG